MRTQSRRPSAAPLARWLGTMSYWSVCACWGGVDTSRRSAKCVRASSVLKMTHTHCVTRRASCRPIDYCRWTFVCGHISSLAHTHTHSVALAKPFAVARRIASTRKLRDPQHRVLSSSSPPRPLRPLRRRVGDGQRCYVVKFI